MPLLRVACFEDGSITRLRSVLLEVRRQEQTIIMDPSQQAPPTYQPGQGAQAAYSLSDSKIQAAPPQQEHPAVSGQPQQNYAAPMQAQPGVQGQNVAVPPPSRTSTMQFADDDPSGLVYTRDPHKLTAYLVPFPLPHLKDQAAAAKVSFVEP